jgi:hypothetical protein
MLCMRASTACLLGLLLLPSSLLARPGGSDPDEAVPVVTATRATGAIHIDGRLDEASWEIAAAATAM